MATDKVIPVCPTCKDAGTYLAQLTRERDEARVAEEHLREMVAALEAGWPDTLVAGSELDAAEFERDEALALLREVGQAEPLCGTLGDYIDVQLPTRVWLNVKAALEER